MTSEVVHATAADSSAVAITLAKAFVDDPVKLFMCGGRSLAIEQVAPFFAAFQKIQRAHGHVYRTARSEAAAIWAPPGEWKVPARQIARHLPTFAKLYGRRTLANIGVLSQLERRHPAAPHYYLEFIGTDPDHQGKGFATALIRPIVEQADLEGVGMYLESSKESNVAFYARFGFEVREELTLRRNGPPVWLMWRQPIGG